MDAKISEEINQTMMNGDDQEEEINTMMEDLRRGPWTVEEDFALINYISQHGEGRWNSLARSAGLKRTGKSCRLRWLNYLRPDVRRGNITLEEQVLILELHSRWGNRWSKIAQHLPGRTDNEIKNYWRTRVQKHAKQLKCDVNSKQFKDAMRYVWMPRLVEKIQASSSATGDFTSTSTANINSTNVTSQMMMPQANSTVACNNLESIVQQSLNNNIYAPENSNTTVSSGSFGRLQESPACDITGCYNYPPINLPNQDCYFPDEQLGFNTESLISPTSYFNPGLGFQCTTSNPWMDGGDLSDNLWSNEDIWLLSQQFNNNNI